MRFKGGIYHVGGIEFSCSGVFIFRMFKSIVDAFVRMTVLVLVIRLLDKSLRWGGEFQTAGWGGDSSRMSTSCSIIVHLDIRNIIIKDYNAASLSVRMCKIYALYKKSNAQLGVDPIIRKFYMLSAAPSGE